MKVVLEAFEFLGDGRGGGGAPGGGGEAPGGSFERNSPAPRATPSSAPAKENLDEDVPF